MSDFVGILPNRNVRALISFGGRIREFNYGAPLTGYGFECVIVNRMPRSLAEKEWYESTVQTRLFPGGKVIHGY